MPGEIGDPVGESWIMTWSSSDIPDLTGRSIIVTGANSGIGLEAAKALAAHGAQVTLAVRDAGRGAAAAEQIRAVAAPGAQVEVARLDLADLASVRRVRLRVERLATRTGSTCWSTTPG